MRRVDDRARRGGLDAGEADRQARSQEIAAVSGSEINLGIDRSVLGERNALGPRGMVIAPMKQADQPAANNCSGLVPSPAPPGGDRRISR